MLKIYKQHIKVTLLLFPCALSPPLSSLSGVPSLHLADMTQTLIIALHFRRSSRYSGNLTQKFHLCGRLLYFFISNYQYLLLSAVYCPGPLNGNAEIWKTVFPSKERGRYKWDKGHHRPTTLRSIKCRGNRQRYWANKGLIVLLCNVLLLQVA